jgi:hypothetical protein
MRAYALRSAREKFQANQSLAGPEAAAALVDAAPQLLMLQVRRLTRKGVIVTLKRV